MHYICIEGRGFFSSEYVLEKEKQIKDMNNLIETLEKHLLLMYETYVKDEKQYKYATQSMWIYNYIQELKRK